MPTTPTAPITVPSAANGGQGTVFDVGSNTPDTVFTPTPTSAPVSGNPQVLGGNGQPIPGAPTLDANGNIIAGTGTQQNGSYVGGLNATNTSGSASDPTATSGSTRATYDALGNDITSMYNTSSIQNNSDQEAALLKSYQDKLDQNFQGDTSGIKAAYDQATQALQQKQAKQYAGTSTSLVTSGGGFLGNTGSHSGVLNSLNDTFSQEQNALMAQRDTALQQAQDAYNTNNFNLAKQQLDLAHQTQQDIYQRQQDQNAANLSYATEQRTNNTYLQGQADKQAASYASMTPAQFAAVPASDIAKIDQYYYPGYTAQLQKTTQAAADVKTATDAVDLESKIIDMQSKIPAGQKFTINGTTYTGTKSAPAGSAADRTQAIISQISSAFTTPGTTIKGSGGIPFSDSSGYATPEGWNAAAAASGLPRATFIKEFGYLLPPDSISDPKYKLTAAEQALVENNSKNPAPVVINTAAGA